MKETLKSQPEANLLETRDARINTILNLLRQRLQLNSIPTGQFSLDNFPFLP